MFVIVILLILFSALYFIMIMPGMGNRPDAASLKNVYYAHRGLHNNKSGAPENSMAAFKKAIESGYGIELDVQLTKDQIPVVFHDETLQRVCGVDGKLRDYTYEELQQFKLYQSNQRIPRFQDVLALVNGCVPLIIEIKFYGNAKTVCVLADQLLQGYHGVYCIESFHPFAVRWYMTHHPDIIRGQLSSDFNSESKRESPPEFLVHYLLTNFLCRPDFIAYDHRHKKNISRILCKWLYHPLNVAWTIRSQQELDECSSDFDLFIFEGFIPKSNTPQQATGHDLARAFPPKGRGI